jgi:hypothetical protein
MHARRRLAVVSRRPFQFPLNLLAAISAGAVVLGAKRSLSVWRCDEERKDGPGDVRVCSTRLFSLRSHADLFFLLRDIISKQTLSSIKDKFPSLSLSSLTALSSIKDKFPSLSLSPLTATLSEWSDNLAHFNETTTTIVNELSGGEGSLFDQIVNTERYDVAANPEIQWDATVRLDHGSPALPYSELAFLRNRRVKMKRAFASYIGVHESEIDERDIPIIGIAGSGVCSKE